MKLKQLLTSSAIGLAIFGARAEANQYTSIVDFGLMELNTTYTYEGLGDVWSQQVRGHYTAPCDMNLKISYPEYVACELFWDSALTQSLKWGEEVSQAFNNSQQTLRLEEGQTVYLCRNYPGQAFSMILEDMEGASVTLDEVMPAEGTPLCVSTSSHYSCTFKFSSAVNFNTAWVTVGGVSAVVPGRKESNFPNWVTVELHDLLLKWLREGTAKEGDTLTVQLMGVTDAISGNQYGEEGTVTATYGLKALPICYKDCKTGEGREMWPCMYSFYQDKDLNGVLVLEFTQDIDASAPVTATLSMGKKDSDVQYFSQDISDSCTAEGNKFTVDFRGVTRTYAKMFPSYSAAKSMAETEPEFFATMQLKISGMKGEDGEFLVSESSSNTASISLLFHFRELDYEVSATYVDMQGYPLADEASVNAGDQLQVNVDGMENFTFDGLRFTYTSEEGENSVTLPKEELDIRATDDWGYVMSVGFRVPDLPGGVEGSELRIDFDNVTMSGGKDATSSLRGLFTLGNPATQDKGTGTQLLTAPEETPAYYTLEGVQIPHPQPGQLVIERKGGKTKKIIL